MLDGAVANVPAQEEEKMAELVRAKKIEGISDIRDESDRDGMRIVIEIKRDAMAMVILNNLYKFTQMETSFGIIFLAIVNGRPQVLTLKEILGHFVSHRREIVIRRTIHDLKKAEERAHILEGYKKALDFLDDVIELIRSSPDTKEAKSRLMSEFDFSEIQAQEILEMRLRRLTGLEREKINAAPAKLIMAILMGRSESLSFLEIKPLSSFPRAKSCESEVDIAAANNPMIAADPMKPD